MQKLEIKIVIADDHELFRDGLKLMLGSYKNLSIVAEAANGKELIEQVNLHKPDVVVTDINMPILDGIEATKQITTQHPTTVIIALSMFDEDDLIMDMLEAGAKGYLLKNAHKDEIVNAIETVNMNNPYYCENTSKKLVKLISKSKYNPYNGKPQQPFNEKELEIIELICHQLTAKEIAEKVYSSYRTIEGIKQRIMDKMEVVNNVGIVIYAIKHKLVKL